MRPKPCEECKIHPAINYDGRHICVNCWPKVAKIKKEVGKSKAEGNKDNFDPNEGREC